MAPVPVGISHNHCNVSDPSLEAVRPAEPAQLWLSEACPRLAPDNIGRAGTQVWRTMSSSPVLRYCR